MKNNNIKHIYFLSVGAFVIILILLFVNKEARKKQYNSLPEFSYREVDGYFNSTNNLPYCDNYIIILFNPACEGCQAEAEIISDNFEYFEKSCLLFLSPDSLNRIEAFMSNYLFYGKDNVFYGQINRDTIDKKLGKSAIPWSFIYDENKELIETGLSVNESDIKKHISK